MFGRLDRLSRRRASAHNVCDRPLWLPARGTAKWRFSLARSLPPGRYTLFSRATDGVGVTEILFATRRGNRRDFRVR